MHGDKGLYLKAILKKIIVGSAALSKIAPIDLSPSGERRAGLRKVGPCGHVL
jgi:hypothetical protein